MSGGGVFMGGIMLLFTVAVVISFFAFREGKDAAKPNEYNSVIFAKNRLMKDKKKSSEVGKGIEVSAEVSHSENTDTIGTEDLVYASSKKYHRGDCRFANRSSDPITIASAKSHGLTPCKICNPKA